MLIRDPHAAFAAPLEPTGLAAIAAAVMIAAHAAGAEIDHRSDDAVAALEVARTIVEACDLLLAIIADLRDHALNGLRSDPSQLAWPF